MSKPIASITRKIYDVWSLNRVLDELGLPLDFKLEKEDIPKVLERLADNLLIEYEKNNNGSFTVYYGFPPEYREELFFRKKIRPKMSYGQG